MRIITNQFKAPLSFEEAVENFNRSSAVYEELSEISIYAGSPIIPSGEGIIGDVLKAGAGAIKGSVKLVKTVLKKIVALIRKGVIYLRDNISNLIDTLLQYDKKYKKLPDALLKARKVMRGKANWKGAEYEFPSFDVNQIEKSLLLLDIEKYNEIEAEGCKLSYLYEGIGKDLTASNLSPKDVDNINRKIYDLSKAGSKAILDEIASKIGIKEFKSAEEFRDRLVSKGKPVKASGDKLADVGEKFIMAVSEFGSLEGKDKMTKALKNSKAFLDKMLKNFDRLAREVDLKIDEHEENAAKTRDEKVGEANEKINEAQSKIDERNAESDKDKEDLKKTLEEGGLGSKIAGGAKKISNTYKDAKRGLENKKDEFVKNRAEGERDRANDQYEAMANSLQELSVSLAGANGAYTGAYGIALTGALNSYKLLLDEAYTFMAWLASF